MFSAPLLALTIRKPFIRPGEWDDQMNQLAGRRWLRGFPEPGGSQRTLRWRDQDSNHRSRVTRPIFECRLWLVPANRKVGAKENRHTEASGPSPRGTDG